MYNDFTDLDNAVRAAQSRAIDDLAALVAFPSVAAKQYAESDSPMTACAEKVAELLRARGLEARLVPTEGGPPVVFAEDRSAGVEAPTVLFYNHYDVQPAEPFDLWDSDPFALRIDGDFAYARGASDDKGHIVCRLAALDALRAVNNGKLPVNVKFVIEGEEEVASVHFTEWIEQNAAILRADVCIWEFGGVDEQNRPEIICGLRGIAYFELHAKTIAYDAHSGVGGSLFPNAAWRLVWALSTLKNADERILLPGHYDDVQSATDADLQLLGDLPYAKSEAYLKKEFGLTSFLENATGVEFARRSVFEPTCTICGIESGYQGSGAKTVLPAKAMAKVDFRLVPNQEPEKVHESLRKHLDENGFTDIEIVYLGGMKPGRVDPHHPYVQLAFETARDVYQTEPLLIPMVGGSGPIHPIAMGLKIPVVTCGVGYPGTRAHAPNENLRLSDLLKGTEHTARFVARLAAEYRKSGGE